MGPRELSSIQSAVPKFSALPEHYPVWSKRFEGFASMSGCSASLETDIEVAVGDTTKTTRYFLEQGLSPQQIERARMAWTCLTESMTDPELLGRVFATKPPSGGWIMLKDWFMPQTMANQVKWSDAFDAIRMEKGEEPMKFFSRVDKVVGVLASLGVEKSVGDVNRKLVRSLTSDYEMEQRTILYREGIQRKDIETIVRQRHLNLPTPKKNVGQTLVSNTQGNNSNNRNGKSRFRGGKGGGTESNKSRSE
ncbi:unnamed protein product, partial [Laminaria digitata]